MYTVERKRADWGDRLMPRPGSDVRLAVILGAVREAISATSLRQVAGEIGLTPSGLQRVLEGGRTPWARTQTKLQNWYVRRAAREGWVDEATARAALAVLLAGAPDGEMRYEAKRSILAALTRAYGDGDVLPSWLRTMRADEENPGPGDPGEPASGEAT